MPFLRLTVHMKSFIERIEIYPEPLSYGRIFKRIRFKLPVTFTDGERDFLDENVTAETEVLLTR